MLEVVGSIPTASKIILVFFAFFFLLFCFLFLDFFLFFFTVVLPLWFENSPYLTWARHSKFFRVFGSAKTQLQYM